VSPTFGAAVGAYALAGLANAPFFVATLGVRARYSPEAARAQVFVSISGLKVAAGSAGAAVAGLTLALGGRTVLAAGGALCLLAALGAALGRRRDPAAPA
jgi:hypothetical protein